MLKNELNLKELAKKQIDNKSSAIGAGNLSHGDSILNERERQRGIIFDFALNSTIISLIFLAGVIVLQMLGIGLGGYKLEVLSVGVFGQCISVIIVITKSLWNDTPYKELLSSQKLTNSEHELDTFS